MLCAHCNTSLNADVKFCGNCGESVTKISVMNPHEESTVPKSSTRMKGANIKAISIIFIAVICVSGIATGFFLFNSNMSPEMRVLASIDRGNFDEANQRFIDNVSGNLYLENAVQTGLTSRIADAIGDFNAGNISFDEALSIIHIIGRSRLYGQVELWDAEDKLNALARSKNAYTLATEAINRKDFLTAIMHYSNVMSSDMLFYSAQEGIVHAKSEYRANVIAEVDSLLLDYDFWQALFVLDHAILGLHGDIELELVGERIIESFVSHIITTASDHFYISNNHVEAITILEQGVASVGDKPSLILEILRYEALLLQERIATVSLAVERYISEKRFSRAIILIQNEFSELLHVNNEISLLWMQTAESFIQYTLDVADEQFGEDRNYFDAIRTIIYAINFLGYDHRLTNALERYQSYMPIMLADLNPVVATQGKARDGVHQNNANFRARDALGNSYTPRYVFHPRRVTHIGASSRERRGITEYLLNGNFSTLTGILFLPYASRGVDNPDFNSVFRVYGDDLLIYEAPIFTRNNPGPVNLNIDITGVRDLRIVMQGYDLYGAGGWGNLIQDRPMIAAAYLAVQR